MNLIPKNLSQLRRIALAVLLASFAILDTNTISAQELGRTITSPFGIARQTSASESGSEGDTFVDPETGEVGHIIRNPFGVANPVGVDTGIDIPDDAEGETGSVITNPFGTPNPDGVDTGIDVIDEDEEYFISLPDDEEVDTEESEDVDEVEDETSDDGKEIEEESSEDTAEEKYIPVKDNPIRGIENESFSFSLAGTIQMDDESFRTYSVVSETNDINNAPTLYVHAGEKFTLTLAVNPNQNLPSNIQPIFRKLNQSGTQNSFGPLQSGSNPPDRFVYQVPSALYGGTYCASISCTINGVSIERVLKIEVIYFNVKIDYNDDGIIDDYDIYNPNSLGKIIHINNLDVDHDGIPDYADGFECNGHLNGGNNSTAIPGASSSSGSSLSFEEFKIRISKGLDLTQWMLSFTFNQSTLDVDYYQYVYEYINPNGNNHTYRRYKPRGDGRIRLWAKDGNNARSGELITNLSSPGDSIPSNVNIDIPLVKFRDNRIEKNDYDEYTIYIEAVKPKTTNSKDPIKVYLKKTNNSQVCFCDEETIYVTPYQVVFEGITNDKLVDVDSSGTHNIFYNPCGLVKGGIGKFHFRTIPADIANSLTWSASEKISFVNGTDIGESVCVQADNNANDNDAYSLEIDIGRGLYNPKINGKILEEKKVKLFVWVVADDDDGVNPAFTRNEVESWVNSVNDIYKQVGIKFEIDQNQGFNYIPDTPTDYRVITSQRIASELVDYPQSIPFPRTEAGLEIFFIENLSYVRGVSYPHRGIIIPKTTGTVPNRKDITFKTLAHELGHACGLNDIYHNKNDKILSSQINTNSLWIQEDCTCTTLDNNPSSNIMSVAGYYESDLKHVDLMKRLLMYGVGSSTSDNRGDISLGNVFGINKSKHFVNVKTGLENMNRTPTHYITNPPSNF